MEDANPTDTQGSNNTSRDGQSGGTGSMGNETQKDGKTVANAFKDAKRRLGQVMANVTYNYDRKILMNEEVEEEKLVALLEELEVTGEARTKDLLDRKANTFFITKHQNELKTLQSVGQESIVLLHCSTEKRLREEEERRMKEVSKDNQANYIDPGLVDKINELNNLTAHLKDSMISAELAVAAEDEYDKKDSSEGRSAEQGAFNATPGASTDLNSYLFQQFQRFEYYQQQQQQLQAQSMFSHPDPFSSGAAPPRMTEQPPPPPGQDGGRAEVGDPGAQFPQSNSQGRRPPPRPPQPRRQSQYPQPSEQYNQNQDQGQPQQRHEFAHTNVDFANVRMRMPADVNTEASRRRLVDRACGMTLGDFTGRAGYLSDEEATIRQILINFYLSLPGQFATIPTGKGYNPFNTKSSMYDPGVTFSGDPKEYATWAVQFRTYYHENDAIIPAKSMTLRRLLDPKNKVLKEAATALDGTMQGYKIVLEFLENTYGGSKRIQLSALDNLRQLEPVAANDAGQLAILIRRLEVYKKSLADAGLEQDFNNMIVYDMVMKRLPEEYIRLVETFRCQSNIMAENLSLLLSWARFYLPILHAVRDRRRNVSTKTKAKTIFTAVQDSGSDTADSDRESDEEVTAFAARKKGSAPRAPTKPKPRENIKKFEKSAKSGDLPVQMCAHCNESRHVLEKCPSYLEKTPSARRDVCSELRLCFRCLRPNCVIGLCTSSGQCKDCNKNHHSTLHGSMRGHRVTKKVLLTAEMHQEQCSDVDDEFEERLMDLKSHLSNLSNYQGQKGGNTSRIIQVRVGNVESGKSCTIFAMLDEGAQVTICSKTVMKHLDIKGKPKILPLTGVGNKTTSYRSVMATMSVESLEGNFKDTMLVAMLKDPVGKLKPINWNNECAKWEHIKHLKFPEEKDPFHESVQMLIGIDNVHLTSSLEEIRGKKGEPSARLTELGWTAAGPIASRTTGSSNMMIHISISDDELSLGDEVAMNPDEISDDEILSAGTQLSAYAEEVFISDDEMNGDELVAMAAVPASLSANSSFDLELAVQDYDDNDIPNLFSAHRPLPVLDLDEHIEKLIEQQLELVQNDLEMKQPQTLDEKYAVKLLDSTFKKTELGKCEVGIIWRKGEPSFNNNFRLAFSRLISLEKSFDSPKLQRLCPNIREVYAETFKTWEAKGYIQVVTLDKSDNHLLYIPHFPVIRVDRATSKVRPVFDGACRFNGKSLNDAVLSGPNYINDVSSVLIIFREKPVCFSADCSEMYLQVLLKDEDRKYHRFLWRSEGGAIIVYEFTRHMFGNACAPAACIHVVRASAALFEEDCPEAADVIRRATIIDDNLASFDTPEEAIKVLGDLFRIYNYPGMKLHKIVSNNAELLATLDESQIAAGLQIDELGESNMTRPQVKALGVKFNCSSDEFEFTNVHEVTVDERWTKRSILKLFMRIFDPHGLVLPFIIMARIIFRGACQTGLDWDVELPPDLRLKWMKWAESLPDLVKVKIPRCIRDADYNRVVKHKRMIVFADASGNATAACAYAVFTYADGRRTSRLVKAMANVAPRSQSSIPRLELIAAVLACVLWRKLKSILGWSAEDVEFFSDSQVVLCWIRTAHKCFSPYVAHRVARIQEWTDIKQWSYVRSASNPADLASRGCSVASLAGSSLWYHGPDFLLEDESSWPREFLLTDDKKSDATTEMKKGKEHELQRLEDAVSYAAFSARLADGYHKEIDELGGEHQLSAPAEQSAVDFERYSSYRKLLRVAAFVRRMCQPDMNLSVVTKITHQSSGEPIPSNFFPKSGEKLIYSPDLEPNVRVFDPVELDGALDGLVFASQRASFQKTIHELEENGHVSGKNPLRIVVPFLEESTGLLRVGSRLKHSKFLKQEVVEPVILHHSHPLTALIIRDLHENHFKHGAGTAQTHAELSRKYHVVSGVTLVRRILKQCVSCTRRRANPSTYTPKMASLTDLRIPDPANITAPFTTCGIDLCGPFITKQGRGKARLKRYIVIFACTVTRCVHLEVLNSMSAEDLVKGISRFLARRPRPKLMLSDNGSNFLRVEKDLATVWEAVDKAQLQEEFPSIQWKFNSPYAPWQGGHYERLIALLKKALYAVLPSQEVYDDDLQTFACCAEYIVNSRPLCRNPNSDGTSDIMLTPAHFLAQGLYGDLAPTISESLSMGDRWEMVQSLLDHFWKRLVAEYLPRLHETCKWSKVEKPLVLGEVVAFVDDKVRGRWPLARIHQLIYGTKDDQVRNVILKTVDDKEIRRSSRVIIRLFDQANL